MKTLKPLFAAIAAVCCSLVAEAADPIMYLDWDPAQRQTTGTISVSFTSKKGAKAKYAVELVWRGTKLFAGHVTRTWKGTDPETKKSANLTASGTAEVK